LENIQHVVNRYCSFIYVKKQQPRGPKGLYRSPEF